MFITSDHRLHVTHLANHSLPKWPMSNFDKCLVKRNVHVPNSSPQTNWSVVVVVVLVLVVVFVVVVVVVVVLVLVLVVVVVVVVVVGGPPFPSPKHKSRAPGSQK